VTGSEDRIKNIETESEACEYFYNSLVQMLRTWAYYNYKLSV